MHRLNDSEPSANRPATGVSRRWAMVALAVVVVLVLVVRVRLLSIPLERDEGEYAYMGQLILEGISPYKLAYNMKLPGIYASYAAIMGVLGQTTSGIHLGFLLINLATLALLFFIARRLFDTAHAIVACICYGLFSISPGVLGLEGHATHVVVLFALAGLLLLLKARASERIAGFVWSGICFGLSFISKQPGLFFCLFGFVILLRDLFKAGAPERKDWIRRGVWFGTAMALPFLLTCLWMKWAGTFDRFWFWTFTYAQFHAGVLSWQDGLMDIGDFYHKAGALRWSWPLAVGGLICLFSDKSRKEAKFIIGDLLVFSLIAFTASFYFSRHYFIMVLPVMSLLIAVLARSAAVVMGEAIPASCFGMACAAFIFVNRAIWFQQTPDIASHALYGGNPFPEAVQIAEYIKEHSAPTNTIAILGSEPEICFYAHRHSATGYIYMYDLMQPQPFELDMQKEAIQQIEAANPAFLLVVHIDSSWNFYKASDLTIMGWLQSYLGKYYDTVGMTWITEQGPEYVWGPEAKTKRFNTGLRVAIWKRKPGV